MTRSKYITQLIETTRWLIDEYVENKMHQIDWMSEISNKILDTCMIPVSYILRSQIFQWSSSSRVQNILGILSKSRSHIIHDTL